MFRRRSRLDTDNLTGAGCTLSPFGTHTTPGACNTTTGCTAKWRCATNVLPHTDGGGYFSRGERDVFGEYVQWGSPIMAADGTHASSDDFDCYGCNEGVWEPVNRVWDPVNGYGEGVWEPVNGGVGTSPIDDSVAEGVCVNSFTCSAEGDAIYSTATDGVTTLADVKCWNCSYPGSSGECELAGPGILGRYASKVLCESSATDMCGWGYEVVNGMCELTQAGTGTAREDCEDIQEMFWKHGCFSQFAMRGGRCVGIPDTGINGKRGDELTYTEDTCDDAEALEVFGLPIWQHASQWQVLLNGQSVFTEDGSIENSILNLNQAADTNGMLTLESEYNHNTLTAVPYLSAVFAPTVGGFNVTFSLRLRDASYTRSKTRFVEDPNVVSAGEVSALLPANMQFTAVRPGESTGWGIIMNKLS